MNKTTEALKLSEEAKVIEKMQQDEIIRMAREACAKVCDEHGFLVKHPPQLSVQDQLRSKK